MPPGGGAGASRVRAQAWRARLVVLLVVVWPRALRAGPAAPGWNWRAPAAARGLSWPDVTAHAARELDPSLPLWVSPSGVVLVPIEPGDHVRVEGGDVFVGFGAGSGSPYPDAITWQRGEDSGLVRIPTWSSARFVVLRSERRHLVRVWVASRRERSLSSHRLDAAVYDWLLRHGSPPTPADEEDRREVATLVALGELAERALVVTADAKDPGAPDLRARYLHAHWLRQRLMRRPLASPFFLGREPRLVGGELIREKTDTDAEAREWRYLRPSEILSVPAQGADVIRFDVRARALGQTRVQVYSGDLLVHDGVFRIPRRAENPLRWTPPRTLRALPASGGTVRLVVVEGSVRVRARMYEARRGWFAPAEAHRPSLLAVRATDHPHAPAWFASLVELVTMGGIGPLSRVRDHLAAPDSHAAAALMIYSALPAIVAHESPERYLQAFWRVTRDLPQRLRTPLRIALLERLSRALPEPIETEAGPAAIVDRHVRGTSPERRLEDALLEGVLRVSDGQRPLANAALEEVAAVRADRGRFVELSALAWKRAAPWRALDAVGGTERLIHRRPFDANQATGSCLNEGPRGLRWWLVPREVTEVDVADLGGTHSSVRLLPLHAESPVGSEVRIDEQSVRVHPTLGVASRVALRPGKHSFRHVRGGAVLARIPRGGSSPCDQLRETERWFVLDGSLDFELPTGERATGASVIVDPSSLPDRAAELTLEAGGEVVRGWVRSPATGAIEITVPPGAARLRVRSRRLLLVRARLRLHRGASRRLPRHSAARSSSTEERLADLTALSRQLRLTGESERQAELRVRRADVLHAMGYRSLADLDFRRAGRPGATVLRSLPGALFLPHYPQAVVPRGLAARAPLLATRDTELMARALELRRLGRSEEALELLTERGAPQAEDTASLLAASLASTLGRTELAAALFERLGEATRSGAFFQAAALEYDRLAAAEQSVDHARRVHVLTTLASQQGIEMPTLEARYQPALEWHRPSLAALGSDVVDVERDREDPLDWSLGERVRRSLTLAPDAASLLTSDASFSLKRFRGQSLRVTALCFDRQGPLEACQPRLVVDGEPQVCASSGVRDSSVAHPIRCELSVGPEARSLEVGLPAEAHPLGWVVLEQFETIDERPVLRPIRWQRRFVKLSSNDPVVLHVAGPSVLRLRARATRPGQPRVSVREASEEAAEEAGGRDSTSGVTPPGRELSLDFPAGQDVGARLRGGGDVSRPRSIDYVVATPGLHVVELRSEGGDALVQPSLSQVVAAPEALVLPESPTAAAVAGRDVAPPTYGSTPVGPHLPDAPLTVSAELELRDRDVADLDNDGSDRFVESAVVVRKSFPELGLWVTGSGGARLRDGATSVVARAAASLSPEGRLPGAFTAVRIVSQPTLGSAGALFEVGARHRVPLAADLNLIPEVALTWRQTDPSVRARHDVDRDVYSAYAAARSHTLDLSATLVHRPFIDTLGRFVAALRLNPALRSVDRVDLGATLQLLPGSGTAPWIGLRLQGSARPASSLRDRAFVRWQLAPEATFWYWATHAARWRTTLAVSTFVDTPNPGGARAGLFAGLTLAYDFQLGAGLSDFRVTSRPFRRRLEEGGPSVRPARPPNDTYWREGGLP